VLGLLGRCGVLVMIMHGGVGWWERVFFADTPAALARRQKSARPSAQIALTRLQHYVGTLVRHFKVFS
jgi:uncharacterized iron-regulated membrane protein